MATRLSILEPQSLPDQVKYRAFKQMIESLVASGWTEVEVFEITVAASVTAAYGRLRIAWEALTQAQQLATAR